MVGDNPEYFDPIELTEYVLLKIGMKLSCVSKNIKLYDKKGYTDFMECKVYKDGGILLNYKHSKRNNFIQISNIKYLHELQNAYYCLTSEELNIELWKE